MMVRVEDSLQQHGHLFICRIIYARMFAIELKSWDASGEQVRSFFPLFFPSSRLDPPWGVSAESGDEGA